MRLRALLLLQDTVPLVPRIGMRDSSRQANLLFTKSPEIWVSECHRLR